MNGKKAKQLRAAFPDKVQYKAAKKIYNEASPQDKVRCFKTLLMVGRASQAQ